MTVVINPFIPPLPPATSPLPPVTSGNEDPSSLPQFGDVLKSLFYPRPTPFGFLGDGGAGDEPPQTRAQVGADIFNENGLFQGAISGVGATIASAAMVPVNTPPAAGTVPVITDLASSAPIAAAPAVLASDPAPAAVVSSEGLATADIVSGAVEQSVPDRAVRSSIPDHAVHPSGDRVAKVGMGEPAHAPLIAIGSTQPSSQDDNLPSSIEGGSTRSRVTEVMMHLLARNSAALSTQVSVQAVENGLRIIARVDSLDREERGRLRDRIAAVLSRHGLIGRTIQVNGYDGSRADAATGGL